MADAFFPTGYFPGAGTRATADPFDTGVVLQSVKNETKRTNLTVSDITNDILDALRDITRKRGFLKADETGTIANSYIEVPTGMIFVEKLVVDDDPIDPITFSELKDDTKTGYAVRDDYIYVTSDLDGKDYELYYSYVHPRDIENIELDETFHTVVATFVTARVFRRIKQYDVAREWFGYYDEELAQRISEVPREPSVGKIRRI